MYKDKTEAKAAFMAVFRGKDAHHAAVVFSSMTPGINWAKCSKGYTAQTYADAYFDPTPLYRLKNLDLTELKRRSEARFAGVRNWYKENAK